MKRRQKAGSFWKSLLRGGFLFVCFPSWPTALFLAHLNYSLGSAKQGKEESVSGRVAIRKTSGEFDYKMIIFIRKVRKKFPSRSLFCKSLLLVTFAIISVLLAFCRTSCCLPGGPVFLC